MYKHIKSIAFLVTLTLNTTVAQKIYPIDESSNDASFRDFRSQLLTALAEKDTFFLFNILDPKIQNSFGGSGGIEEFKEKWRITEPNSRLWNELSTIINLGGTFQQFENQAAFIAPYVYSRFPDSLGGYGSAAATGANVRIHLKPSKNSATVEFVSYDYLVLCEDGKPFVDSTTHPLEEWIKVYTPKKQYGYISKKYCRSPLEHRVCFVRKNDSWKITWLIAGD